MKHPVARGGILAIGARSRRALDDAVPPGVGRSTTGSRDPVANVHEAVAALAVDGPCTTLVDPDELEPRPRAALRAIRRAAAPHEVLVFCEPGTTLPPRVARALVALDVARVSSADDLRASDEGPAARSNSVARVKRRDASDAANRSARATLDEVSFADGCFRRLDRPDALCRFVLARLGRAVGSRRTSLMLLDDARTGLFVKAARGMDPSLVGRVRIALSGGLAGRSASLGRVIAGRAAVGGPRAYLGSAYVLLPLGRDGRCEGVVSLTELPGDVVPSDDVLRSVRRMGDRAGRALGAARRIEQAEVLSATDELTSLPNRRSFERALHREMERCRRAGTPLAVALLDIDHFKQLNDKYGHPAGDRILIQVARRIAGAFRETDLVCRWGGEEFAVLLPALAEGTASEALSVVERARAAVAGKPLTLGPGLPCPVASISGGVAIYPTHGADAVEVLRRADEALYAAKRTGRDRVLHA